MRAIKQLCYLLIAIVFGLSSCEDNGKKASAGAAKKVAAAEESPANEASPANESSAAESNPVEAEPSSGAETPTLDLCNQKYGKIYQPIPASCLEEMVTFECCKEKIIARYPSIADQIGNSFANKLEDGFELYNCGQVADDKIRLHWMKKSGDLVTNHKNTDLNGATTTVDDDSIACAIAGSKPPENPEDYIEGEADPIPDIYEEGAGTASGD